MTIAIQTVRSLRHYLLKVTEELTITQLNNIPAGFKNNIIWNMGHMITAQQALCYKRAGLNPVVDESFFQKYGTGKKPEDRIDEKEHELIKEQLFSTLDRLESDYSSHIFANYQPFTTRYGIELSSVDSAIDFLPFHEGYHIGFIMALKNLLTK